MKKQGLIRQGDVLLIPRTAAPAQRTPRPTDNGRVILAYGEVTGHAHAIEDAACATLYDTGDGGVALEVRDVTRLTHEEHAPAVVCGWYDVVIQSEYTPEAIQNVLD